MSGVVLPDDVLGALAGVADVQADEVIEKVGSAVLAAGFGDRPDDFPTRRAAFPELLRRIGRDARVPAPVDPQVAQFLDAGAECDPQIDHDLVRHAQAFFVEHGVAIIAALFHASLPEAYLGRRGVQVLDMTGELATNWTRRIQETGQFLINVMSPAPDLVRAGTTSLSAGELAARATRRVRLTHAAVRWLLSARYDPELELLLLSDFPNPTVWDVRMIEIGEEELHYGSRGQAHPRVASRPLNQEDLLATLGTFTTVVFGALEKMAVPFDDDDRRAVHHVWNVVGWHLGIGASESLKKITRADAGPVWPGSNILPLDVAEMDALYRRLEQRLQGPTEQGRRLATTLVQELSFPLPRLIDGAPGFLVRYFIGDDHADQLGIEKGGYAELVIRRTRALERAARRARRSLLGELTFSPLSQAITRYALRAFVSQARGSDRGLAIEQGIASQWGIQTGPEVLTPLR